MKLLAILTCSLLGAALVIASKDFPDWGDPHSPANSNVSPYFLTQSIEDNEVPNIVSAVLADYRSFDTMLETTVVLIAAIAIIFLIRRSSYEPDYKPNEDSPFAFEPNIILQTVCRILIPVMQIFALYVIAHGHHSPGGGFQGGVILGAMLILHSIVYGLRATMSSMTELGQRLCNYSGVLIFFGTGLLCLILGYNFLDYSALTHLLPVSGTFARSFGILIVEVGVALTVMSVMFSIYADLASAGDMDRGI